MRSSYWLSLTALTAITAVTIPTPSNAQSGDSQFVADEIIVNATRRSGVDIQSVPASIVVYTEETLEKAGIDTLTDMTRLSASLISVQTQSPTASFVGLRGISTSANNVGFDASVGVSIDGVVRSRTGVALSELTELSSVEVLRGPQGTLFGRNTTAGVIAIQTPKPDPDGGGFVSVSRGNYGEKILQGAVNFAVNEEWAARIDGRYRERDGYLDDLNLDRNLMGLENAVIRGQLAYEGDKSSIRIIADWAKSDNICCGAIVGQQGPTSLIINGTAALLGINGFGSENIGDYQVSLTPTADVYENTEEWGLSMEVNYDLDGITLTSITSYRDWESLANRDGDLSPLDLANAQIDVTNSSFTQEFRAQGEYGRINWLVGAYYINDEVDEFLRTGHGNHTANYIDALVSSQANGAVAFGTIPNAPSFLAALNPAMATTYLSPYTANHYVDNNFDLDTSAFAIFTHNEISLSERANLTVGLRYTDESKSLDYAGSSNMPAGLEACNFLSVTPGAAQGLAALAPLLCNPGINPEGDINLASERDYDDFSGSVKLSYDVGEDAMVYASISRGFKSGGYNLNRSGFSFQTYGGTSPADTDLQFEEEVVNAYEFGWNSTLMDGAVIFNGAIFRNDIENLQSLEFNGVNFAVDAADAETYGVELDLLYRPTLNLTLQAGYANTTTKRDDTADGEDEQFLAQPEHALTAAITYTKLVAENLQATAHLNARYSSETHSNGLAVQDKYGLVNARLGLSPEDGNWEVSFYADNLFDEDYFTAAFSMPMQTGSVGMFPGMPRTYGTELRYRF